MQIIICTGTNGRSLESCGRRCDTRKIIRYLKKRLRENDLGQMNGKINVMKTKCLMRCTEGPVLLINPAKSWYTYCGERDIEELVSEHVVQGRIVERLLLAERGRGRQPGTDHQAP